MSHLVPRFPLQGAHLTYTCLLCTIVAVSVEPCPLNATIHHYPDYDGYYKHIEGWFAVAEGSTSATAIEVTFELAHANNGTLNANISPYPAYVGEAEANGTVKVMASNETFINLTYALTGLVPDDSGALHIHEGTSCENAGDHYYTSSDTDSDEDPWSHAEAYYSDSLGNAEGTFNISNGYSWADYIGHVAVVHDVNGTRIGCGKLVEESFALEIREGSSCKNASEIGDPYYSTDEDPWNSTYIPDEEGYASGHFTMDSGEKCDDNDNRVAIIHGEDGIAIGCGVLYTAEEAAHHQGDSDDTYADYEEEESTSDDDITPIVLAVIACWLALIVISVAAYIYVMKTDNRAVKEAIRQEEEGSVYSTFNLGPKSDV